MADQQPETLWRVALVVSSADPRKHIPWLATGEDDMKRVEAHRDFIRWLSPRSDELSRLQAAGGQGVEWPALPELPAHARLYYTGRPPRRYKRASVCDGPGESLVLTSTAIEYMRRRDAQIRAAIAAHPPAAPALVPLPDDQIKALCSEVLWVDATKYVMEFARAIERAHGINGWDGGCDDDHHQGG